MMMSDEELFREYLLRKKRDRLMAGAVVKGAAEVLLVAQVGP